MKLLTVVPLLLLCATVLAGTEEVPRLYERLGEGNPGALTRLRDLLLHELPREASLPPEHRPPLESAVGLLQDKAPLRRQIAAATIARFGADASPALPAIGKALKTEKDESVLYWYSETVRRLRPEGRVWAEAMLAVIRQAGDVNFAFRNWTPERPGEDAASIALLALGSLGRVAEDVLVDELVVFRRDAGTGRYGGTLYHGFRALRPLSAETMARLRKIAGGKESRAADRAKSLLDMLTPAGKSPPEVRPPDPPGGRTPKEWVALIETWIAGDAKWEDSGPFGELIRMGKRGVPALLAAFRHEDPSIRFYALTALAWLGPRAAAARELLRGELSEGSLDMESLLYALSRVGLDARTLALVIPLVDDPSYRVRESALLALAAAGPAARAAIPRILRRLEEPLGGADSHLPLGPFAGEPETPVRSAAVKALAALRPRPEEAVLPLLHAAAKGGTRHPPPIRIRSQRHRWWYSPRGGKHLDVIDVRESALVAVAGMGPDALPVVVGILESRDTAREIAEMAVLALVRFPDGLGLPALRRALDHRFPEVRSAVVGVLAKLGPPGAPGLADAVGNDLMAIRSAAISALREAGHPAGIAAPALAEHMREAKETEACEALRALVAVSARPRILLVHALESALLRPEVAVSAAEALRELGEAAEAAADALLRAAGSGERRLRSAALTALVEVAPEDPRTAAALRDSLSHPEGSVRLAGVNGIFALALEDESTVEVVRRRLMDERAGVRITAARHLGTLGERAAKAVPDLLLATRDGERAVQVAAIDALGSIPVDAAALDEIAKLTIHRDAGIRRSAVEALVARGCGKEEIVPELVAAAETGSRWRRALATALVRFGLVSYYDSRPQIELLRRKGWTLRHPSNALYGHGKLNRNVTILRDVVIWRLLDFARKDGSISFDPLKRLPRPVRRPGKLDRGRLEQIYAAAILREAGPALVPVLRRMLAMKNVRDWEPAALALGGLRDVESIPAILRLADTRGRNGASTAAEALKRMRAPLDKLIPLLTKSIPKGAGRWVAYDLGADAAPLVPVLVDVLPEDRRRTAKLLGEIGPPARSALPVLLRILPGSRPDDRREIVRALASIGVETDVAVPALVAALRDPDEKVRLAAVEGLAARGRESTAAVDGLTGALADPSPAIRRATAEAVASIGPAALSASPGLAHVLESAKPDLAVASLRALGTLGPRAEGAVSVLLEALRARGGWEAYEAACALGRTGGDGEEVIQALVAALGREDWRVRLGSVLGLSVLPLPRGRIRELLRPLLGDPAPPVRRAVTRVLAD